MKNQRKIFLFLFRFFVTYFLLLGLYSWYLSSFQSNVVFSCDSITEHVTVSTETLVNRLGYSSYYEQHPNELSFKFYVNDVYVARIIEGCNAVSVIILFLAFIIAFKGDVLQTILFGVIGSGFIYLVNIARIAFLSIIYYKYPEYQEIMHTLVFPSIIYGFTFLLWIVWVKKFSKF